MQMLFNDVQELGHGIWKGEVNPHHLLRLCGETKLQIYPRSLIFVEQYEYNDGSLMVSPDKMIPCIIGTTSEVIFVHAKSHGSSPKEYNQSVSNDIVYGPGDTKFLKMLDELNPNVREVGKSLLDKIRKSFAGDLKQGQRRNFSNSPDNFWYVVVQPRVESLSITVRGDPNRFNSEMLELKVDRPGYTRFQLRKIAEVEEAFRIISQSKKKF